MKSLKDKITVIDNFLPKKDYVDLVKISRGRELNWKWQTSDPNPQGSLFHNAFVTDDEFFNTHIFNQIQNVLPIKVTPLRIYFNSQVPLSNGTFHRDDGDLTVLFYPNPYEPEWGGWTQFHNEDYGPDEEMVFVSPWPNRLCFFDAKILHKGHAFNHQTLPIRYSLTYKLKKIEDD